MARSRRRRLARALLVLAVLAAALLLAAKWRAAQLPAVEMPVLLWTAVAPEPDDPATVAKDAFIDQVSDLWNGGFETPSPFRLQFYADWGWPLPDAPVLLRLGEARADLVEPDGVEAILEGADFTAFVDLPCEDVEAGAPGLLSWDDVRAAAKRGTLRFAPCASTRDGAKLSPEDAVALYRERVGRAPDAVSLHHGDSTAALNSVDFGFRDVPGRAGWGGRHARLFGRTAVLGGRHGFALELRQDSVDPALFGTLAVSHPSGSNPPADGRPLVLLAWQGDDPDPIVDEPLAKTDADGRRVPLAPGETFEAPVPAKPKFPVEICVYDDTRTVLYFRRTLYKNEVKRDPSWRPPVLDPEDRLEIEPL